MIKVEVLESPLDFKLVNGLVYIYGGVFQIGCDILDLNNTNDIVFKCTDTSKYDCNYSDFPNVLCSRNLYKRRG